MRNDPFLLGGYVEVPDRPTNDALQRAAGFLRTTIDALHALVPQSHPAWGHLVRAEDYMVLKDSLGVFGAAGCARAAAYGQQFHHEDRGAMRQCVAQARAEIEASL